MRSARRVSLKLVSASFGLAASVAAADAADWYTGAYDPQAQKAQPTVAIDVSFDGSSQNAFSGALIGTIAPFSPLVENGLRLRLGGFGGVYQYVPSEVYLGNIHGEFQQGEMLVGYEWISRQMQFGLFGGVEISHDGITPNDPNNTVKGTHGGLKIGADFYASPTELWMASAIASYSTDHNAYYSRFKFGFALAPGLFAGPEALALGDDFFHQFRVGAHLSGLRVGNVQLGVSGGFLDDEVRGAGAYGLLDTRFTF